MSNLDKIAEDSPQNNTTSFNVKSIPQSDLLANSLSEMFPEQAYENKTTQRAKEILGSNYSTEDTKSLIASFEYLINSWLEEYEKKVFNKTLKELLDSI